MHLNSNSNAKKKKASKIKAPHPAKDESSESEQEAKITKSELKEFLTSIDGIGKKKVESILDHVGSVDDVVGVLHQNPSLLTEVKGITKKLVSKVEKAWKKLLK
jgi:ERCC4-type nuclease